ncbi:restriction endonuclease [Kiloniella litopenaei]|uniref:restriction endonuclease n=1 Tax=Kiloniella litopenaei TaxID=1549748 RepID=UPI003BAC16B9
MIPNYQQIMLPLLKFCLGGEISTKEIVTKLASYFALSDDEVSTLVPSGQMPLFQNRVSWAKTYLKQAGLIAYPSRSQINITDAGLEVLKQKPTEIDKDFLLQFQAFREFQTAKKNSKTDKEERLKEGNTNEERTPDENLSIAHRAINDALAADLLDRVRKSSPDFFEQLIIDLLLSMGYGGSIEDAGRTLGKSGDDGIDGVIDQDPLGVDQIYVQAKRYKEGNNIGSGAMRDFFGALNLKGAQKGIFFTTSSFSKSAIETAERLNIRIVLVDGLRLSKLMILHNVGCREEEVLYLKKVDEDFFESSV